MRNLTLTLAFLLLPSLIVAQHRGKPALRPKAAQQAAKPKQDLHLYRQLMPATAKVMFIDSVVVPKRDFLARLPLNPESGTLTPCGTLQPHGEREALPLVAYENELGDRRILAMGDTAGAHLAAQTLLGEQWGKPVPLAGVSQADYGDMDFPFLAADGVTLYFSAEGERAMGGRDIFFTSFDTEGDSWYEPQNMGLPFNSTANDYLLAFDDLDSLGWLVTDRRQPEDSVCIYTFVPTRVRQDFSADGLDDDEIEPYARILGIASTWKFGDRKAALARRDAMLRRLHAKRGSAAAMRFVVDDQTVVTSPDRFRNATSRGLYAQVVELRQMVGDGEARLDSLRRDYHQLRQAGGGASARLGSLAGEIGRLEQALPSQQADLRRLEQRIRLLEQP